MPVLCDITCTLNATETGTATAIDLGTISPAAALIQRAAALNLVNGLGVAQANILYQDTNSIAASGTATVDLNGGAIVNSVGAAATFVKVKGLWVVAAETNVNDLVVGGGANAWAGLLNATGTFRLHPGGFAVFGCGKADNVGWATVAGTGDVLTLTNGGAGTPVGYDIFIVGTNA